MRIKFNGLLYSLAFIYIFIFTRSPVVVMIALSTVPHHNRRDLIVCIWQLRCVYLVHHPLHCTALEVADWEKNIGKCVFFKGLSTT